MLISSLRAYKRACWPTENARFTPPLADFARDGFNHMCLFVLEHSSVNAAWAIKCLLHLFDPFFPAAKLMVLGVRKIQIQFKRAHPKVASYYWGNTAVPVCSVFFCFF